MQNKHLKSLLLCVVSTFCLLCACVDNDYNLNKDISLEMNVGGDALKLPFGNSEKVTLTQLIDTSEVLKLDNGQYSIRKYDDIQDTDVSIDPIEVNVNQPERDPIYLNFEKTSADNINRAETTILKAPVEDATTFDIDQEVPEEVKVIREIEVAEEEGTLVHITMKFKNYPTDVEGNLYFDTNFKIVFPDFIRFQEIEGNTLSLANEQLHPGNSVSYQKTLHVKMLDFSSKEGGKGLTMIQKDGKNYLVIDNDNRVDVSGDIRLEATDPNIDPTKLRNIEGLIEFEIETMNIGKVTGTVEPVIDPINESFVMDLGDDLDFLKNEDTKLNIYNPQVVLELSNTVGIPVAMNLELSAVQQDGNIQKLNVPNLTLKPAEVDGQPTFTKIILSKQGLPVDGYESVKVEGLSELIEKIPEDFLIDISPVVIAAQDHHVDVTKDMKIGGKYGVNIPLRFEGVTVNYKDTIDNLIEELKDFSDVLREVGLDVTTDIVNTIPLPMELTVTPLDSRGRVLLNINVVVQNKDGNNTIYAGVQNAGGDLGETITETKIYLTAKDNSLEELDALELTVKVNDINSEGDIYLKENQYFQLTKMNLIVKGGINLDLN